MLNKSIISIILDYSDGNVQRYVYYKYNYFCNDTLTFINLCLLDDLIEMKKIKVIKTIHLENDFYIEQYASYLTKFTNLETLYINVEYDRKISLTNEFFENFNLINLVLKNIKLMGKSLSITSKRMKKLILNGCRYEAPILKGDEFNLEILSLLTLSNIKYIRNYTNLRKLTVKYYHYPSIKDNIIKSEDIKHLTKLESLEINEETKIDDEGIKDLVNLKRIRLYNNLTITSKAFEKLNNIKILSLECNGNITGDVIKKYDLEILSLYSIKNLKDTDLKNQKNLKVLYLFRSNIGDNIIKHLTNLQILYIDINNKTICEGIRNLTKLKKLSLMTNKSLTDSSIINLRELETIILPNNNNITVKSLKRFRNLSKIRIKNNKERNLLAKYCTNNKNSINMI